jgi:mono/diheme cytochrome c family protein
MRARIVITFIVLVVVMALVAIGCGASDATTTTPTAAFSEGTGTTLAGAEGLDGKALFEANCARCHGRDLDGGVGPTLRTYTPMDIGGIETQTLNGGGQMPPFRDVLSEAEIAAIANYIVGVRD